MTTERELQFDREPRKWPHSEVRKRFLPLEPSDSSNHPLQMRFSAARRSSRRLRGGGATGDAAESVTSTGVPESGVRTMTSSPGARSTPAAVVTGAEIANRALCAAADLRSSCSASTALPTTMMAGGSVEASSPTTARPAWMLTASTISCSPSRPSRVWRSASAWSIAPAARRARRAACSTSCSRPKRARMPSGPTATRVPSFRRMALVTASP